MSEEGHDTDPPVSKKPKLEDESSRSTVPENEVDFTEDNIEANENFTIYDKYQNFVTPEEIEKLKEFKILDEVKSGDEDSNDEESDSSEGMEAADLPDEEIEKMLDENLPEELKGTPKPKEKPYVIRTKVVLEEKGVNQFEVLPMDWMLVRHYSGLPIYMHRPTRVCTLAKPYSLGKGNTRRHDIPISAIPCLAYRRALEEEKKQEEIDRHVEEQIKNKTWSMPQPNINLGENANSLPKSDSTSEVTGDLKTDNQDGTKADEEKVKKRKCPFSHLAASSESTPSEIKEEVNANEEGKDTKDEERKEASALDENSKEFLARCPVVLPGGRVVPAPRVESLDTSWKTQHLSAEQITDYCKSLFKFKTVNFMHFNRWADRRKYTKARKALQYPKLPKGTKLITIPNFGGHEGGKLKRDWVMNMNGGSYLSEFHEYVCRVLHKQPTYEYKQLENASTPYQVTVMIDGMAYGVGRGASKRQAKYAAARASIQTLIPAMRAVLAPEPAARDDADCSFFDTVPIEDPRIAEFCATSCEPSPHAILLTCLLRNFGIGEWHVKVTTKKLEYQKMELTMRVGKHSATVVCKNKKTAKQRAAQAILQALHPHVTSWGSLLRLYGSRSVKSCKEKKLEEQQITLLQDKARHNEPNYAVLDKLRCEMRKLQERDQAVVPLGTLLLADTLPEHSASNLNNVDL